MGPAPGGLFGNDWVFVAAMVTFLAAALAIHAAFLFTLMRCLQRVHPDSRAMAPGLVWLGIIPVFNHLWYLIMIPKVTASLRDEWRARGWFARSEDFGHTLGMIYAIGTVVAACLNVGLRSQGAGCLSLLLTLGLLVVWIVYWVKVAGYSRRLGSATPPGEEFADYDDEFRPRPPDPGRRDGAAGWDVEREPDVPRSPAAEWPPRAEPVDDPETDGRDGEDRPRRD